MMGFGDTHYGKLIRPSTRRESKKRISESLRPDQLGAFSLHALYTILYKESVKPAIRAHLAHRKINKLRAINASINSRFPPQESIRIANATGYQPCGCKWSGSRRDRILPAPDKFRNRVTTDLRWVENSSHDSRRCGPRRSGSGCISCR